MQQTVFAAKLTMQQNLFVCVCLCLCLCTRDGIACVRVHSRATVCLPACSKVLLPSHAAAIATALPVAAIINASAHANKHNSHILSRSAWEFRKYCCCIPQVLGCLEQWALPCPDPVHDLHGRNVHLSSNPLIFILYIILLDRNSTWLKRKRYMISEKESSHEKFLFVPKKLV